MRLAALLEPRCLLACALALPAVLDAAPAPWYQWRSKIDARLVCAQTSLGPGWEQASGPYRDAHCERRIVGK
ncbi:hypothetical protein [Massilia sp. 9096]|uniref:hypothetical protein n=1 Tax=Massilia sp. 9096 TaxID=1500894 RepID=UPI000A93F54A|nr:hypothetical protein [Massilia sp. 9096]